MNSNTANGKHGQDVWILSQVLWGWGGGGGGGSCPFARYGLANMLVYQGHEPPHRNIIVLMHGIQRSVAEVLLLPI